MAALEGLGFSVDWFDRASYRREDPAEVARLRARDDARALLIARDMPVLRVGETGVDALLPIGEIEALGGAQVEALLGLAPNGAPIFAALLADEAVEVRSDASDGFLDRRILVAPGREDLKLVDLRSIAVGDLVPRDQAAMLAAAKALMHWHAHRRFCSNCGALNEVAAAGWRRECKTCNTTHFPRTDPVVIMLAVDGDACLLGRQPRFPKGMYSALAGFVEPGETIEAAVRREIWEEAGVACRSVRYFASQPWPFPASLMIGCFAEADGRGLEVDRVELEDARWFSREETVALIERRHPARLTAPTQMAIAHHLLKRWAYEGVEFRE
ncbi:MAG TPA: NAD(+) diphosphatase [Roseiarcus sp.]|nr:NAD(+) diphosphatase [Roseiarcus sp.]